jgi:hypothetical protein
MTVCICSQFADTHDVDLDRYSMAEAGSSSSEEGTLTPDLVGDPIPLKAAARLDSPTSQPGRARDYGVSVNLLLNFNNTFLLLGP